LRAFRLNLASKQNLEYLGKILSQIYSLVLKLPHAYLPAAFKGNSCNIFPALLQYRALNLMNDGEKIYLPESNIKASPSPYVQSHAGSL